MMPTVLEAGRRRAFTMDDEFALRGERSGISDTRCFRCGRDPDVAHGHDYFCPGFADYRESGEWISFERLFAALEAASPLPLSKHFTCGMEELEGPAGTFHRVLGVYADGRTWINRFDWPRVPEFSLWEAREPHNSLYKGWRIALRESASRLRISRSRFEKRLGISLDRSTEEIKRFMVGYL